MWIFLALSIQTSINSNQNRPYYTYPAGRYPVIHYPEPNELQPRMVLTTGEPGACSELCDCHEVDYNFNRAECLFGCEGSRNCLSAETHFGPAPHRRLSCRHCFVECYTTTPDPSSYCYRHNPPRTNPCLKALKDGEGLYPTMIAAQFPADIIIKSGARRNLLCTCINQSIMRCKITVEPDSLQAAAVFRRLDRSKPMELRPFFIDPNAAGSSIAREVLPLLFQETGSQVTAEIWVDYSRKHLLRHWVDDNSEADQSEKLKVKPIRRKKSYSSLPQVNALSRVDSSPHLSHESIESDKPKLRRSKSAPEALHYATNGISIDLCGQSAVCPITQMPFAPGDVVYVLKSEAESIALGKEIVCLSAPGLKSLSIRSNKFVDPLKRENQRLLTIENDYVKFVLQSVPSRGNIHKSDSTSSFDDTAFRPSSQSMQNIPPNFSGDAPDPLITNPDDDFDDEINRPVNSHLRRTIQHDSEQKLGESIYVWTSPLKYFTCVVILLCLFTFKFCFDYSETDSLTFHILSEEL